MKWTPCWQKEGKSFCNLLGFWKKVWRVYKSNLVCYRRKQTKEHNKLANITSVKKTVKTGIQNSSFQFSVHTIFNGKVLCTSFQNSLSLKLHWRNFILYHTLWLLWIDERVSKNRREILAPQACNIDIHGILEQKSDKKSGPILMPLVIY
jgi:hypothetical protein